MNKLIFWYLCVQGVKLGPIWLATQMKRSSTHVLAGRKISPARVITFVHNTPFLFFTYIISFT